MAETLYVGYAIDTKPGSEHYGKKIAPITTTEAVYDPVKGQMLKHTLDAVPSKTDVATSIGDRTRENITARLSNLATAVAEQNLEKYGYAIGDYFIGNSGYTYHLADRDTYYGGYNNNAVISTHHCGIVVDTHSSCQWNSSGSAVRYDGSTLHSYLSGTVLDNIKDDFNRLFGDWSQRLLAHNMLANGIGTWDWSGNNYIRAMTEVEVYGAPIWSADSQQQGEAVKHLELFQKFRFNEIFGNTWFWLRSLRSASGACVAGAIGYADGDGVAASGRASGLILFH